MNFELFKDPVDEMPWNTVLKDKGPEWSWMIFKVPFSPSHSMILQFYGSMQSLDGLHCTEYGLQPPLPLNPPPHLAAVMGGEMESSA